MNHRSVGSKVEQVTENLIYSPETLLIFSLKRVCGAEPSRCSSQLYPSHPGHSTPACARAVLLSGGFPRLGGNQWSHVFLPPGEQDASSHPGRSEEVSPSFPSVQRRLSCQVPS